MALTARIDAPRQESTVQIDAREVVVVSEVVFEPELIVVTRVLENGICLTKKHTKMPVAVVRDLAEHGPSSLGANLQLEHLRHVRHLLVHDDRTAQSSMPLGSIATLTLGDGGEVLRRAGEEHVPADWLRAAWVFARISEELAAGLSWGALSLTRVVGSEIEAEITTDQEERATVHFTQPSSKRASVVRLAAPDEAALEAVVASGTAVAAATYDAGGAFLARGFTHDAEEAVVRTFVVAARPVLRGTKPTVDHVLLQFEASMFVVGSSGESVVVARLTDRDAGAQVLDRMIRRPKVAATNEEAPAMTTLAEGVNRIVAVAREHLGGPVIRNYLKRARADRPLVTAWQLGLDGRVSPPESPRASTSAHAEEVAEWIETFLAHAAVIAPELARVSAKDVVDDLGFWPRKNGDDSR